MMKKCVFTLLFIVVFAFAGVSGTVHAIPLRLSYVLNYYPPNPCQDDYLTGVINIFELTDAGFSSVIGDGIMAPPNPCGESVTGSFVFNIAEDTNIYLSLDGSIMIPTPGSPEVPVYSFDEGTAEGDRAVEDVPESAPFIFIGKVIGDGSILYANPGPPNLPLFSFSSPGVEVGSLGIELALSYNNNEPREFIIMKRPFRHVIASPLPTTPDGNLDVKKLIVESSMTTMPDLNPEMEWYLSRVIFALQEGNMYTARRNWKGFISSIKNGRAPIDFNSLIQWVIRQSYLETAKDLSYYASRVKYYNDLKKALRDELDEVRRIQASLSRGDDCELCIEISDFISRLEEQSQCPGDDAELATLELQKSMQKHSQTIIMITGVIKKLNEIAMGIMRNLKQ